MEYARGKSTPRDGLGDGLVFFSVVFGDVVLSVLHLEGFHNSIQNTSGGKTAMTTIT